MLKGYVVAHIRVQENDVYEQFKRMAGPAIAEHGGLVLVRNPDGDYREGGLRGSVVVVEFDEHAAAQQFYESEAYTAARRIREKAAETDLVIVEGLD